MRLLPVFPGAQPLAVSLTKVEGKLFSIVTLHQNINGSNADWHITNLLTQISPSCDLFEETKLSLRSKL
jgi:hypothetical protein